MATAPCTAFAVINVDKIYSGGVKPDEHFSRLGYTVRKYAWFEDLSPPVDRTWIAFIPYLFFGKRNCTWNLADQFVVRSGCTAFPKNCPYIFTGIGPKWTIFPTPPPTGAVHLWFRADSQFAVMIGEEVRYHPLRKL